MSTYQSDIELGKKYRHNKLDLEGLAVGVYFFEHACERVALQWMHDGELHSDSFDALELVSVDTGEQAKSEKKGGPRGPSTLSQAMGGL